MDHRLRMDEDAYAVEPDREQMMRLDQFEALVHHRHRIDADLSAHRPVGMGDGLRRGDMRHRLGAEGAERDAARGKGDPPPLVPRGAGQALKYRLLLRIKRTDRNPTSGAKGKRGWERD